MTNQQEWQRILDASERELGFDQGYKFLYGPWSTLKTGKAVFVSLNPGLAPDATDPRVVSDERGNSYEVEKYTTKSPLTDQFLRMCQFLSLTPSEFITGVVAPFRTNNWSSLSKEQKQSSLELGRKFWTEKLARDDLRLIVACSDEAAKLVVAITRAKLEAELLSGWGEIKVRRYRSNVCVQCDSS